MNKKISNGPRNTDTYTVIVEDLNTRLSPMDSSSRQKVNKETSELLHPLDKIDMIDSYRIFHPTNR
jgi:hypothetical protein